jgi:hypothetical protein
MTAQRSTQNRKASASSRTSDRIYYLRTNNTWGNAVWLDANDKMVVFVVPTKNKSRLVLSTDPYTLAKYADATLIPWNSGSKTLLKSCIDHIRYQCHRLPKFKKLLQHKNSIPKYWSDVRPEHFKLPGRRKQ